MEHITPSVKPRAISSFFGRTGKNGIYHYQYMFIEDIFNGVMPVRGMSQGQHQLKVIFDGETEDKELAIKACLSLSRDDYTNKIEEILSKAITNITKNIAWEGAAYYEIINVPNDKACPYLHWFTSHRLVHLPFFYVQIIPRENYKHFNKRFSIIPSSKVWKITIPRKLGGKRQYKRSLQSLKRVNSLLPKFINNDINAIYSIRNFDLQYYLTIMQTTVNKLTAKWGWNRRDTNTEHTTEFYYIYKNIIFYWALAQLREHVLKEINTLLKRLKIHCNIKMTGILSSDEILTISNGILDGSVSYEDAIDKIYSL